MQVSIPIAALFPYAFVTTFLIYFFGLFAWWAKARFYNADKAFLKIDQYLRKNGMWALLNLSYAYIMAAVIFYGCSVLFLSLWNKH
jgi:hypothetical protein